MRFLFETARYLDRKQNFDFQLVIIGEGISDDPKYFKEIKQLAAELEIKDILVWTGRITAADVSALLTRSLMVLLPYSSGASDRRGSLLAALAHAKPIVTTRPSLPIPLCAYALATVDEKIYLFGGWDGQQFVDHVYFYDPDNDNWNAGEPMPVARGFAAAGAIEGVVYVVGGYDGIREFADNYAYHIADDTWTQKAPMSIGRGGLGAAVVGDKLYAIGGGWRSFLSTNERYDPESNSWIAFESPILSEWRNLGVAASDTQIYAVGGWSGGGYTEVNQAYQAILRIILPIAQ